MEFEWLNDSRTPNKRDEITPPRSPRLAAPTKVTRICGNLTTSRWLKVRTLTEGCGRVQVAGGGRIGRCRCWVILDRLGLSASCPGYPRSRLLGRTSRFGSFASIGLNRSRGKALR